MNPSASSAEPLLLFLKVFALIHIFSLTHCGTDEGISFDSFNILEDEEVRQGLKTYSNWPTYPQLYVNGKLVGGLDILKVILHFSISLNHYFAGIERRWRFKISTWTLCPARQSKRLNVAPC